MEVVKTLEEARETLRNFLIPYISKFEEDLKDFNGDKQVNIRCFSKEHLSKEDLASGKTREDNASVTYYPGNNTFYCHKEKKHLDIFNAANFFEDMPIFGIDFIKKTIPHLCNMFGLKYSEEAFELSEKEKKMYKQYKIFEILEEHILTVPSKDYLKKENISGCDFSIGTASWDYLFKEFKKNNITEEDLKPLSINKFTINSNKLIYIIKDKEGRAISFTSKEMVNTKEHIREKYGIDENLTMQDLKRLATLHEKGKSETINGKGKFIEAYEELKNYRKYINSNNSLIFSKQKIFFGIEHIVKDNPERVFIFEGTKEVVKARENGVYALGYLGVGSKTDYSVLNRSGISEIIVCFDNDEAGEKAKIDFVNKDLKLIRKKVLIGVYKKEIKGKDYDEIVKNGEIKIDDIFEYIEPFDYLLSKHINTIEKNGSFDEKQLIDMVSDDINSSDVLEAHDKITFLSKYTPSYDLETLKQYFKSIKQNGKLNMVNVFKDIALKNSNLIKEMPIEDVVLKIKEDTQKEFEKNNITETKTDIFNLMKNKVNGFWEERMNRKNRKEINWGYDIFDGMYNLTGRKVVTVVAKPNIGKSTFFANLVHNLLKEHSEEINIVYFSTDDSSDEILSALAARSLRLTKEFIHNPFKDEEKTQENLFKINAIEDFMENVNQLSEKKILSIPDTADELNTAEGLELIAKQLSESNEKKLKILLIDSVNKIKIAGVSDDNERISKLSELTRYLSVKYNILIIQNFEPNKLKKKEKVDESKIRGSARILHDSDAVITLHQPLHELSETTKTYAIKNNSRLPVIVAILEKTRVGGFKNKFNFMKLDIFTNELENVSENEYEIFKKSFEIDISENYFKGVL